MLRGACLQSSPGGAPPHSGLPARDDDVQAQQHQRVDLPDDRGNAASNKAKAPCDLRTVSCCRERPLSPCKLPSMSTIEHSEALAEHLLRRPPEPAAQACHGCWRACASGATRQAGRQQWPNDKSTSWTHEQQGTHHEGVGDGPVQRKGEHSDIQLRPHDALGDQDLVEWPEEDLQVQGSVQGLHVHPHQGHHLQPSNRACARPELSGRLCGHAWNRSAWLAADHGWAVNLKAGTSARVCSSPC